MWHWHYWNWLLTQTKCVPPKQHGQRVARSPASLYLPQTACCGSTLLSEEARFFHRRRHCHLDIRAQCRGYIMTRLSLRCSPAPLPFCFPLTFLLPLAPVLPSNLALSSTELWLSGRTDTSPLDDESLQGRALAFHLRFQHLEKYLAYSACSRNTCWRDALEKRGPSWESLI